MTAHPAARPAQATKRLTVWQAAAIGATGSAVIGAFAAPVVLGWHDYRWLLLYVSAAAAIVLAVIDERTGRLPNRPVAAMAAGGIVQAAVAAAATGQLSHLLTPLAAAAIVLVLYAAAAGVGWCGFGDAKAAATLTLYAALYVGMAAIYMLPVAATYGLVRYLVAVALGRRRVRQPHGAALAAAMLTFMLADFLGGI